MRTSQQYGVTRGQLTVACEQARQAELTQPTRLSPDWAIGSAGAAMP